MLIRSQPERGIGTQLSPEDAMNTLKDMTRANSTPKPPRKHRQRYTWGKWIAILADKCPWPQGSFAFEAWCDLTEWREYFDKGYSPHVAIGLRFGYLEETA
jgi:hypothetical protein